MDRYSILDSGSSPSIAPVPVLADASEAKRVLGNLSKEENKSPAELAKRELEASLQLLTERAQYVTGASGAAIALVEDGAMVCMASRGASAPALGAHLQLDSGLTGESLRTRQLLRCDDAENDPRVNRQSCQALGIASVIVMPVVQDGQAVGVFELLSDRIQAFEDRDIAALRRLAEMLETVLEHSNGARRAAETIAAKVESALRPGAKEEVKAKIEASPASPSPARVTPNSAPVKAEETEEIKSLKELLALPQTTLGKGPSLSATSRVAAAPAKPLAKSATEPIEATELNLRKCTECGFPVSGGRTLCLDCDELRSVSRQSGASATPDLFANLGGSSASRGWWHDHSYTIGTVLVSVATAIAVWLWRR